MKNRNEQSHNTIQAILAIDSIIIENPKIFQSYNSFRNVILDSAIRLVLPMPTEKILKEVFNNAKRADL